MLFQGCILGRTFLTNFTVNLVWAGEIGRENWELIEGIERAVPCNTVPWPCNAILYGDGCMLDGLCPRLSFGHCTCHRHAAQGRGKPAESEVCETIIQFN